MGYLPKILRVGELGWLENVLFRHKGKEIVDREKKTFDKQLWQAACQVGEKLSWFSLENVRVTEYSCIKRVEQVAIATDGKPDVA